MKLPGWLDIKLNLNCNLNCELCSDHAFLYKKTYEYDLELFEHDLKILSSIIDLTRVVILGGEPTLLKNLEEYFKILNKYKLSDTMILLSNGIYKDNNAMADLCKKYDIKHVINNYKLLDIKENGYTEILPTDNKEFNEYEVTAPHKTKNLCERPCWTLYNGKFYKCFRTISTADYLKQKGINDFKDDLYLNVDEDLTWAKLMKFLLDKTIIPESCIWCGLGGKNED